MTELNAHERIVSALNELEYVGGFSTSTIGAGIASYFESINCKGAPEDCTDCPVYNYLQEFCKIYNVYEVSAGDDMKNYVEYVTDAAWLNVYAPKLVNKFICKFDEGEFPEIDSNLQIVDEDETDSDDHYGVEC